MNMMRVLVAAVVTAVALPAAAQSSALAGRWQVEYQRGIRNENGEMTPIMGKGTLTLEQKGDSLVGQLAPEPMEGGPTPPPLVFAAKATGASATFTTKSQARIQMNGEEQTATMVITWDLSAAGDALTGSMKRALEGHDMPTEPAPLKGTRLK